MVVELKITTSTRRHHSTMRFLMQESSTWPVPVLCREHNKASVSIKPACPSRRHFTSKFSLTSWQCYIYPFKCIQPWLKISVVNFYFLTLANSNLNEFACTILHFFPAKNNPNPNTNQKPTKKKSISLKIAKKKRLRPQKPSNKESGPCRLTRQSAKRHYSDSLLMLSSRG